MHTTTHRFLLPVLGGLFTLLLGGCATNVGSSVAVSDSQVAKYSTLSVSEARDELEKRLADAREANMTFLAPDYYREAMAILTETKKASEKTPKDQVIQSITKADAILDKGQTMMAIVQDRLSNPLAMKAQLEKDGVEKVYPWEYQKSVEALSGLIEDVELGKTDKLDKESAALLAKMQALDVKTIQYNTLHASNVINEDTLSKDGEKQAKATLTEAQRVYRDAENRIALTPHDEVLVKRAGADALFAALHARYVNERVMALQVKVKDALEPIALEEEKRLLGISTALGQNDLRDHPLDQQAEEIANFAGDVIKDQQRSKKEMEEASGQKKDLESRVKEAGDVEQQAKLQLAEKDAEIKKLSDQILELRSQIEQIEAAAKAKATTPANAAKPVKAVKKPAAK